MDFVYPRHCHICDEAICGNEKWVCQKCYANIQLLKIEKRCPRCFHQLTTRRCEQCKKHLTPVHQTLALFPEGEESLKLLSLASIGPYRDLTALVASFYVLRYYECYDKPPDYITYTSRVISTKTMRLLAQEVARLMNVPKVLDPRKHFRPPAAALTYLILSDAPLTKSHKTLLTYLLTPMLPGLVQHIAFFFEEA